MKELVEAIAKALVDHPEQVQVNAVEGEQVTVLELRVHPEDLGKVIGRQGRTAKSIRTLLGAAGMKLKKAFYAGNPRIEWPRKNRRISRWRASCARTDGAAKWPPKSSPIFPNVSRLSRTCELWDGRSEPRDVRVRSCWLSHSRGGQAIFHFEGSDSISDAEKLVGLEVQIPFADRMPLPSGSYYITDLIGCEVREKNGARDRARGDVQFTGEDVAGTPILVVDSPQGELLDSSGAGICVHVDTDARRIEVVLPEGLRELNRE